MPNIDPDASLVDESTPSPIKNLIRRARFFFACIPEKRRRLWKRIRFGKITEHVIDRIEGTACEVEYRGRGGKVVGFWAYGYFCPDYPYRGDGRKYGGGYDERPIQ